MKALPKVANRPAWLVAAAGLCLAAAAAFLALGIRQESARPAPREPGLNVLLVTVDTLRWDAPGFAGRAGARTPVLDRLAQGGVRFTTAYSHNVVTLPSHANLLSGRLPTEHGVHDNAGARFPPDIDTLATLLKARGYRTAAFVSAFPVESRFGLARGFDVYDDQFADAARPAFLEQERRGSETVARARAWLESGDPSRPYFCWVHIYEPHFPYAPDYDSDVAAADAALAPLLAPLVDAGASGRTIVAMTSDHGESLGEHGEATHGIFAYDATLRVPLVLYAPRLWPPRVVEGVAAHVDILPTVLDALAQESPAGLSGRSLLPAIADQRIPDRPLYFEALSGALARGWAPLRGVLSGSSKYIDLPIPELYDLSRDPRELNNLEKSAPERARAMSALLAQWPEGDAPRPRVSEEAEVRERLRSLGYVTADAAPKRTYTSEDDPKNLIALDRLLQEVTGLYLDGRLREAIARCRELVSRRPSMAVSLMHLAHLEREAGNLTGGIDALRRALAIQPSSGETASLLATYLTEAGRPAEAVSLLDPFSVRPDADVQVLVTSALARARLGQHDAALADVERARALDPTSAAIPLHAGTIQMMAGRIDAARAAFEEALERNPSLARAHSSLGAIAAGRGDRDAALAHWRAATSSDAAEFRTVLGVGAALARGGRGAEARPYLEFFVSAAPPAQYAREIARAREWLSNMHRNDR